MPNIMKSSKSKIALQGYNQLLSGIQQLLEEARHQAARSVNALLTARACRQLSQMTLAAR